MQCKTIRTIDACGPSNVGIYSEKLEFIAREIDDGTYQGAVTILSKKTATLTLPIPMAIDTTD